MRFYLVPNLVSHHLISAGVFLLFFAPVALATRTNPQALLFSFSVTVFLIAQMWWVLLAINKQSGQDLAFRASLPISRSDVWRSLFFGYGATLACWIALLLTACIAAYLGDWISSADLGFFVLLYVLYFVFCLFIFSIAVRVPQFHLRLIFWLLTPFFGAILINLYTESGLNGIMSLPVLSTGLLLLFLALVLIKFGENNFKTQDII